MTNVLEIPAPLHTLGNELWFNENKKALAAAFPETWTHIGNINFLQLGYKLKVLGIDWSSQEELAKVLAFLEQKGVILRDGFAIRKANI